MKAHVMREVSWKELKMSKIIDRFNDFRELHRKFVP